MCTPSKNPIVAIMFCLFVQYRIVKTYVFNFLNVFNFFNFLNFFNFYDFFNFYNFLTFLQPSAILR